MLAQIPNGMASTEALTLLTWLKSTTYFGRPIGYNTKEIKSGGKNNIYFTEETETTEAIIFIGEEEFSFTNVTDSVSKKLRSMRSFS